MPAPSAAPNPECPGCVALLETVARLTAEIQKLQARVSELEARLKENSSNSHRPPSTDPPWKPRPAVPKPTGRKRGGQPGHEGTTRDLLPPDEVDEIRVVKPASCCRCEGPVSGIDPQPVRHQVTELPPIKPRVTEYELHALACSRCGAVTRAALPAGVPERAFGVRIQAFAAMLTGAYRLSKRAVGQIMADCFGVNISLGSISNLEAATSGALEVPVEEAKRFVREQSSAHLDETGWSEGNKRAWLWTAVTTWVTVFLVRLSRGAQVAKELLGERFWGVLISDRWSGYKWLKDRQRQLCWAHLIRDFRKMTEFGGSPKAIGAALLKCARKLFEWWHRIRDGTLARSSFRVYVSRLRPQVTALLRRGAACMNRETAAMCRAILQHERALWTFARIEGIEPTNNAAERAIRPVVLWRKGSFGTQSSMGSRFVERMLTAVATLRQQRRNVLDYITAACDAALHRTLPPSLLPQTVKCSPVLADAA